MPKLILATTVAAVVSTGALAADAIIAAEPEPIEYVRVCDAFGSGYFYIPGTETCLKLSGYVRMRVYGQSEKSVFDPATRTFVDSGGDSYNTLVRARLTIDAKSDTELGELHGRLRLQAQNDGTPNSDASYGMDQGYLQLGGLFAGYSESAWVYSTNGGATGFGGKGIYDGDYGYQQRNMLQYQYNGANFFAVVSIEDDADSTSWTPDIVGRIGGVINNVTVFAVVGYDQRGGFDDSVTATAEALGVPVDRSSQWGAKVGVNTDIGRAGNLIVQGYYASGPTSYGANIGLASTTWTPQWSILGAYGHDLTSSLTAYMNHQYSASYYDPITGNSHSGANSYAVSGGVEWTPVTNFAVTLEARYTTADLDDGLQDIADDLDIKTDWWEFAVQLQRNF